MSAELIAELKSKLDEQSKSIDAKLASMAELSEAKHKEELAKLEEKMSDYVKIADELKELKNAFTNIEQKGVKMAEPVQIKSLGESMTQSEQFKNWMDGRTQKARVELKNTIVNSGNDTSRHEQLGGVVAGAFRMLNVMGTVTRGQTSSNIIYYSKELAWTNNAAGTAEAGNKPESSLTFEEVSREVKTIAHFIKISKQALADSTFLASYIDRRMGHGVNNKIEDQIINGDGLGQNLSGWLATGNHTPVLVGDATNFFDYTNNLKYAVIAADYSADVYYVNPTDWSAAEQLKVGTGDSRYIGADGAITYTQNGLQPMLWGLPVVLSNNIPAGTVVCKSFDADMYADRESTVIEMFEQDGDNVTTNLITVRAESRGAELVFVPAAIVTADLSTIA
tara:strand:- start:2760 stop:3941 length:1182 start_codon:yes stop_codon:yes gene_type:complete